MSLPPSYDPKLFEKKWRNFWKSKKLFAPKPGKSKKTFSIVMPPPNVTGVLHMGHALVNSLQDIIVRYKRMQGFETLWVPGTDHAGISTQTIVEKHLMATEHKKRVDYTREEFLKKVWQWKDEKEKNILEQIEMLGCSCDWDHLCFTLDEKRSYAVKKLFKKLFDDGLIYRGDYLVHWDPVTQTALAEDEVETEEKDSFLWYFRYPLENNPNQTITVATTRPETMLGDTAVAVHPEDARYSHLIGQNVVLPLVDRKIPIIADSFVEKDFGTGAVKVTPAHDFNDYALAERHKLPLINVLTPDGKINENGKNFQGLTIAEARIKVIEAMKALNYFEKQEPYKLRVGVSYRSKAVIEPFLSKQWFVKLSSFKEVLQTLVQSGKVTLIPSSFDTTYFHWISHLHDWCISRQLWWGHRIPIWYNKKDPLKMICYIDEGLPKAVVKHPKDWIEEEDVLDTWFSSALWPFSVLGWPRKTDDLKKFYPNSLLITGHDILFFWVARMMAMGQYVFKKPPFPKVFLHGLIFGKSYWRVLKDGSASYLSKEEKTKYDMGETPPKDVFSKFEKMSKSKGNVIDPLEIIDHYGTDAARLGLCSSVTGAAQIDLDQRKFEEFKNFINKFWNGSRFIIQNLMQEPVLTCEKFAEGFDEAFCLFEDFWMLSKMNRLILDIGKAFDTYRFDEIISLAYRFFWEDFCSNYLEMIKPTLYGKQFSKKHRETKQKLLVIFLVQIVKIFHPFMPFVTEEIFACLKNMFDHPCQSTAKDPYTSDILASLSSECCMTSFTPKVFKKHIFSKTLEKEFALVQSLIYTIRNLRGENGIPLHEKTDVFFIIKSKNSKEAALLEKHAHLILACTKTQNIFIQDKKTPLLLDHAATLIGKILVMIPLSTELKEKEKARLIKEKEKWTAQKENCLIKLQNPNFVEKAPKEIVDKLKAQFEEIELQLAKIEKQLTL